jgi:hypothetical protein
MGTFANYFTTVMLSWKICGLELSRVSLWVSTTSATQVTPARTERYPLLFVRTCEILNGLLVGIITHWRPKGQKPRSVGRPARTVAITYINSSFGRYCSASAKCTWVIALDSAKSAMVRESSRAR